MNYVSTRIHGLVFETGNGKGNGSTTNKITPHFDNH